MNGHPNKLFLALLLLLYTLITAYIGYRTRKSKSSEDYFLASRSLPSWILAITFIASWWGGGSAIDLVDDANKEGLSTFWIYGVPVLIATALMYLFSGGIRRVANISQPEMVERRYDSRSALMLTLFIIVFMTIGAAIQVIVIAKFFSVFFGVSYSLGAIIGTACVLVYSIFGGFRGVVLTDLFQFVFFLFASILLFYMAYDSSGGWGSMLESSSSTAGYTSFMHNIGDNIAYVITFGTSWMIQANVWQRISAARTPSSARKMMGISFMVFIPLYLMVTLTGMFSLVSYPEVPEGGVVSSMLLGLDNPILSALIFVGLSSAIMSTMDSMFNTGALALTIDFYKRYIKPDKSPTHYVYIGRISTLIIAVLALFIGTQITSVLTISWIGADFIATGAFVPLIGGFIWRRGTATAALVSMVFGFIFSTYNLLVAVGIDLPVHWEIASAKQAIIGISTSTLLYVVVSLLTKANYPKADSFIATAAIVKRKQTE